MASGDRVVEIMQIMPPAANQAGPVIITGGSSPGERIHAWAFDADATEYIDFLCRLSNYGGNGLLLGFKWMPENAVTGTVVWSAAIRRLSITENFDTAHTYVEQSVIPGPPTTQGEFGSFSIILSDGAQMDNWSDTEFGIIRVGRVGGDASDTMLNDAYLVSMTGLEL